MFNKFSKLIAIIFLLLGVSIVFSQTETFVDFCYDHDFDLISDFVDCSDFNITQASAFNFWEKRSQPDYGINYLRNQYLKDVLNSPEVSSLNIDDQKKYLAGAEVVKDKLLKNSQIKLEYYKKYQKFYFVLFVLQKILVLIGIGFIICSVGYFKRISWTARLSKILIPSFVIVIITIFSFSTYSTKYHFLSIGSPFEVENSFVFPLMNNVKKDKTFNKIKTKEECVALSGRWESFNFGTTFVCNLPTKDKGQLCDDVSECEGTCFVESFTAEQQRRMDFGEILKLKGQCSGYIYDSGCNIQGKEIKNGRTSILTYCQ